MSSKIDTGLATLLADYQVHYHKLRGYHWTVTGPLFFGLHAQFEQLYLTTAEKVDAIAERIAARGGRPPVTMKEVLGLARLKEDEGQPSPNDMVRGITSDLETLNGHLRALAQVAGNEGDTGTVNLLDGFADEQEKSAWMLRAFLAQ
jgi:starvation-inducible DNA-binding protein